MRLRALVLALAAPATVAYTATASAFPVDDAPAAPVVLFSDDAENGPETKWELSSTANSPVAAFQRSDSSTLKARGNQRASGARSFWAGVPVNQMHPVEIQTGTSSLTTKDTIIIPAEGAKLTYASLFQNEGDDQGRVEVIPVDGGEPTEVDAIQAVNTNAGDQDDSICQPAQLNVLTQGLAPRTVDLVAFAGQEVRLRFSMAYGAENRVLSQPCGWFIDDITVTSVG